MLRIITNSALIAFLCLGAMSSSAAPLSRDSVSTLQVAAAEHCLQGFKGMIEFTNEKDTNLLLEARTRFFASDTIFSRLLKCCPTQVDTARIRDLLMGVGKELDTPLQTLLEMAAGEKVRTSSGGQLHETSRNEMGHILFLSILKVRAESFIDSLNQLYFTGTWKVSEGTVRMRAHRDISWTRKLGSTDLADKYIPLMIQITNKSQADIELNPLMHRFVIQTKNGQQLRNADLSFEDYGSLESLREEEKQLVFREVTTIYAGSNVPIIVFIPRSAPSPSEWARIIFESQLAAVTGSLPRGDLTRER